MLFFIIIKSCVGSAWVSFSVCLYNFGVAFEVLGFGFWVLTFEVLSFWLAIWGFIFDLSTMFGIFSGLSFGLAIWGFRLYFLSMFGFFFGLGAGFYDGGDVEGSGFWLNGKGLRPWHPLRRGESAAKPCLEALTCVRFPGFVFRVSCFVFQVSCLRFWVSGFGFRVSGSGFRVLGFGSWVSGYGLRVSGFGFRISGFGFRVLNFGSRVSGFGFRVLGSGIRGPGFGFRVQDQGFRGSTVGSRNGHQGGPRKPCREILRSSALDAHMHMNLCTQPEGYSGANLTSISQRCYLREVAFE